MKVARALTAAFVLFLNVNSALAQSGGRGLTTRRIRFERGHTDATLHHTLRPGTIHVHTFHARAGQRMSVRLRLTGGRAARAGDAVFWVQSKRYIAGRNTTILEGIDPRGGAVDWSGELPLTGEYEIYLSNPEVSDHLIKYSLRYALAVSIE
jgi:hypothetical protein